MLQRFKDIVHLESSQAVPYPPSWSWILKWYGKVESVWKVCMSRCGVGDWSMDYRVFLFPWWHIVSLTIYYVHKHRINCQIVSVTWYWYSRSPKFKNTGPIEILFLSHGAILIERPLHLYPLTSTSIIIVRGPLDQGNIMHCQGFGR